MKQQEAVKNSTPEQLLISNQFESEGSSPNTTLLKFYTRRTKERLENYLHSSNHTTVDPISHECKRNHKDNRSETMMLFTYNVDKESFGVNYTRRYRVLVDLLNDIRSPCFVPFFLEPTHSSQHDQTSFTIFTLRGKNGDTQLENLTKGMQGKEGEEKLLSMLKWWSLMMLSQVQNQVYLLDSNIFNIVKIENLWSQIDFEKPEIFPQFQPNQLCPEQCFDLIEHLQSYYHNEKTRWQTYIDLPQLFDRQEFLKNLIKERPDSVLSQDSSLLKLCRMIRVELEQTHKDLFLAGTKDIINLMSKADEQLINSLCKPHRSAKETYASFLGLVEQRLPRSQQHQGIYFNATDQQIEQVLCESPAQCQQVRQLILHLDRHRMRMTSTYLVDTEQAGLTISQNKVYARKLKNSNLAGLNTSEIMQDPLLAISWMQNLVCLCWDLQQASCEFTGIDGLIQAFSEAQHKEGVVSSFRRFGQFGYKLSNVNWIKLRLNKRSEIHRTHLIFLMAMSKCLDKLEFLSSQPHSCKNYLNGQKQFVANCEFLPLQLITENCQKVTYGQILSQLNHKYAEVSSQLMVYLSQ